MIETILTWLASLVISVISKTGYLGITVLMALESACIPIPSEIIMPFSGFLVFEGQFIFWQVVVWGSIGNLIGSNIFNIMTVLGITSMISPINVNPELLSFDYIWVIIVSILLGLSLYIGNKVGLIKGILLTVIYVLFTSLVVFKSLG